MISHWNRRSQQGKKPHKIMQKIALVEFQTRSIEKDPIVPKIKRDLNNN
jgi:hypothetical protein